MGTSLVQRCRGVVRTAAGVLLLLQADLAAANALLAIPTSKLLGGAAATEPDSPAAASVNPALAGTLQTTESEIGLNAYQNTMTTVQYPGSTPSTRSLAGVDLLSPNGGGIWKLTPKLGIGITAVPPGLGATVTVPQVPVPLFGQVYEVDVKATVKTQPMAILVAGYQLAPWLSLGLRLQHLAADINGALSTSDTHTELATFTMAFQETDASIGMLAAFGHLSLGVVVNVASTTTTTQNISVPTLAPNGVGGAAAAPTVDNQVFPGALVGIGLRLGSRTLVMTDVKYTRADPTMVFSPVDRVQKPLDSYATVGVNAGVIYKLTPRSAALLGGQYEPAGIGEGGRGPGTKSGYGVLESTPALLGQDLAPYYGASLGGSYDFGQASKAEHATLYRYSLAAGIAFQTGSIGISKNGEQPGGYMQSRFMVPVSVKMRL